MDLVSHQPVTGRTSKPNSLSSSYKHGGLSSSIKRHGCQQQQQQSWGPVTSDFSGLSKKQGRDTWPAGHAHPQEDRVALGASVAKANEPSKVYDSIVD